MGPPRRPPLRRRSPSRLPGSTRCPALAPLVTLRNILRGSQGRARRALFRLDGLVQRLDADAGADLRLGKAGIMKVAAAHGVGVGTVQRIKASLNV